MRPYRLIVLTLTAAACLSACQSNNVQNVLQPPSFGAPQVERDIDGNCYGRDVTPALVETVTEQVVVQPAELAADGSVTSPAVFRTVTRQEIVRERREVLFETICPEDLTPEFIASLQRALAVRGYYAGPISALMDFDTHRAIRAYQRREWHDSPLLDIRAARELGLVALDAAQLSN